MYEDQTYDVILDREMQRILDENSNIDTRAGSMVFFGNAPGAVELQNLYIAIDAYMDESFADTASREFLIRRAAERGLTPESATAAVLKLEITPTTLDLAIGTRFSIGELNYSVTKNLNGGSYEITCETLGEAGNSYGSTVIPIEYIDGLQTCKVTSLLIPGENEEDTEVFRQRYYDSLDAKSFGGNVADYVEKVNKIQGVGGVRVYRAWNADIEPSSLKPPDGTDAWIDSLTGVSDKILTWLKAVYKAGANNYLTVGGTVKLIIISSLYDVPSQSLLDLVQETVDPIGNQGDGYGTAPIGHVVEISGVSADTLNIGLKLTYQDGYSWSTMQSTIESTIENYFLELAKTWADETGSLIVRVSQIETRILDLTGILDIDNTTINGSTSNYSVPKDSIPTLGTITAS